MSVKVNELIEDYCLINLKQIYEHKLNEELKEKIGIKEVIIIRKGKKIKN